MFVWEDSTWIRKFGKPIVKIWARDTNTLQVKEFQMKGVTPYFYVEDADGDLVAFDGTRIRKVEVNLPSDVPKERQNYTRTFEADILYDYRCMIDKSIWYAFDVEGNKICPVELDKALVPRIVYFDIEVKSPPEIIPSPKTVEWPIVTIQCIDNYSEEMKVFTWGVEKVDDAQVVCVDEKEMIQEFVIWLSAIDPDVITGWYSNGFDMPYLIRRAFRLGAYIDGLSRQDNGTIAVKEVFRTFNIRITGRQSIDMMEVFQNWHKPRGQRDSWGLKDVAKDFLGIEYEDLGGLIQEVIDEGRIEELMEYCKKDVEVLIGLDKKLGLFEFYEYLRMKTGVKLRDTLSNSKMIEMMLLRSGIKPIPTRVQKDTQADVRGATVLTPPVGIANDVGVFDLKSLYPSIIIMFDISPDIDKLVPKVIVDILNERDKLRQLRLEGKADETVKTKEVVLKFLANSFYGVLAWPGFKMFNAELASQITGTGRELIGKMGNWFNGLEKTVYYGDSVDPESPIFVLEDGMVKIVPIDEVKVGDLVWTGWTWEKVKNVIIKPKRKKMYQVVTHDGIVVCTEDHSLMQDGVPVKPLMAERIDWVEFPEVTEKVDDFDKDIAWLIGFYLAEGSYISSQYVFNNQSIRLMEKCQKIMFDLCGQVKTVKDYMESSACYRISAPNELKWIFEQCYSEKGRKIVPLWILNHQSEEVLKAFIDGFYDGDGSVEKKYKDRWKRIDQRSSLVAVGLQFVLERLGYTVTVRPAGSNKRSWGLRIGRYRKTELGKIKKVFEVETKYDYVVDIEVENNHVFAVGHSLLHNTDSVFVGPISSVVEGKKLQDEINERLKRWAEEKKAKEHPVVKFEKLFKRILFAKRKGGKGEAAKKRYAGWLIWEDGKKVDEIKIVGFEKKRSDAAMVTKELFEDVIERMLVGNDIEGAAEVVKDVIKRKEEMPIAYWAIPRGVDMGKEYKVRNPWIEGVRVAQEHGVQLVGGEKPRLVYLKRPVNAICIGKDTTELPHGFEVDWEKMVDVTITKKFRPLFESVGYNWDVLVKGQTTLERWWK